MRILSILLLIIKIIIANGIELECETWALLYKPTGCVVNSPIPIPKDASITFKNQDNNITFLELSFCMFDTIPMNLFVEHPKLTGIKLSNNGIKQLQMINFKNANQLALITFASNDITMLKNSTFYYCPNLKDIMFHENENLRIIETAAFKGLTKLTSLSIYGSKIESFKNIFDVLPKLNSLYLSNNSMKTVNENLFKYNVNLENINLNDNHIVELPANLFDTIKNLKILNLSNNRLLAVSTYRAGVVHLYENQLKTIHITEETEEVLSYNNKIETITCANNLSVNYMYLTNNSLTNLNCIVRMQKLRMLYLEDNKFTKLSRQSFMNWPELNDVKLSDNKIAKLSPQIFSQCKNIRSLSVDNLLGYKTLKQLMPKLYNLQLTTRNWNCAFLTKVVGTVMNQSIYLVSNNVYEEFKYFKCQTPIWKIRNDLNGIPSD